MQNIYRVIIEIPEGNRNNKYEYDEKSGEFKLDFVFENIVWPYNYGFIPGTRGGDGDALDAMVLSSAPLKQGQEAECKIIGMIDMLDKGEEDFKIICIPIGDPLGASLNDIADISDKQKREWEKFFSELARQKKKLTVIRGFLPKAQAERVLMKFML